MENKDYCMDDDFYGVGEDEGRSAEVKGITGEVSSFTYTNLQFPCILFKEGTPIPKHKLKIVSNMVKSGNMGEKDTSLYFIQNGDVFKIGSLSGNQIMGFLDLMGLDCLEGYLGKENKLEGGLLYSLCTVV